MRASLASTLIGALAAFISSTDAHGYVAKIIAGDRIYEGADPAWVNNPTSLADTPGWYSYNQNAEFVTGIAYRNHAITCHKGGSPGSLSIRVEAGSQITLQWARWPHKHNGIVLDYLAKCSGSCVQVQSRDLKFFKIDDDGLYNGTAPADGDPGVWATHKLLDQSRQWTTTIPLNIEPGHYVLRHELIALHRAFELHGVQHYPQCVNLEVTNSDGVDPCLVGADCRMGTELYDAYHPGLLINIYHGVPNYTLPGPLVWTGLDIPMHK